MNISHDDLKINSETSTLIFSINSQYSDPVLNSLAKSLREKKYDIKSRLKNKTTMNITIFKNNQKVGTIESHYVWLVANLVPSLCEDVMDLLKTDFSYFGQIVCRVPHTDKRTILDNDFSLRVMSGLLKSSDEMVPYSIFFLHEKQHLIGKALIKYFNSDMGEYEPTILFLEMSDCMQDKADVFVKLIEEKLRQNGFVKLWIKDIQNDDFWNSSDYQIDDNNGVKYLKTKPKII